MGRNMRGKWEERGPIGKMWASRGRGELASGGTTMTSKKKAVYAQRNSAPRMASAKATTAQHLSRKEFCAAVGAKQAA
jgi:hypothetical protein